MRNPPRVRAAPGAAPGPAAAPDAPHTADGGPGCAGAACGTGWVGGGADGVGAGAGPGADSTRRRPSTHASHPFEHRTNAQSARRSRTITSSPGSRVAAGAVDPSGPGQAGSPSVGTTCVWV